MRSSFGQIMEEITIQQNRSNGWTAFGVFMAIGLLTASTVGMILNWPMKLSFEWIIMPLLFIGSLVLGFNYTYWIIAPRNAVFYVSDDEIRIEDQPVFKWISRTFPPSEVIEIYYSRESGSRLKTRDGKTHTISDILMMQREAIFSALAVKHPHIALKEYN